ncbi:MAG: NUDIX hydrolase [Verrucomicrobia bacterium]|nr:NUDIX hydrolase [Verrucomicrobiota bacterium]
MSNTTHPQDPESTAERFSGIEWAMHERTLHSEKAFQGKLLRVNVLDVELECGKRAIREIVKHPGAAVILAQRPDSQFVFVRQYRKAVEMELLEVVAGTIDPGETPDACAHRELTEETGYTATSLKKLGEIYPAPGYSEEVLHVYFAELSPDRGAMRPDDDERLEVELLSSKTLEAMIKNGDIRDAKTLAAWTLYRSNQ